MHFCVLLKNTTSRSMYTLNCNGKIVNLGEPQVMGIINVTPDSFYEHHASATTTELLALAGKMLDEGATMLDIGGQSTRPGSKRISPQEELHRILPHLSLLRRSFPQAILSVDTYYSEVANAAASEGADMINDISGGNMDEAMLKTVGRLKLPYICMHMQGVPETMQENPVYKDVVKEVLDFFSRKIADCREAGIHDIIIDPGFGFGKTTEHNFSVLKELAVFKMLNVPILAGLSRKGMIYRTLGTSASGALNGTTALNTIALLNGASILRVHDVKEAMETTRLMNAYKKAAPVIDAA